MLSETMEQFQYAIHNLKYRLDYYRADYTRKYYSNSKNPKVIHSKLNCKNLLSLRTCPRDKYMINPGEFLSTEPKRGENEELNDNNSHDDIIDTCSNLICFNTDPYHSDFYDSNDDSNNNMGFKKNPDEALRPLMGRKIMKGFSFTRKRLSEIPLIPSPILEINSAAIEKLEEEEKEEENKDQEDDHNEAIEMVQLENSRTPNVIGDHKIMEYAPSYIPSKVRDPLVNKNQTRFIFNMTNFGRRHSITEGDDHILYNSSYCLNHKNNSDTNLYPWKTVYNNISLSAARVVSVGEAPKSKADFTNLTSDFVAVKPSKDVFNSTLEFGKRKYFPPDDKENDTSSDLLSMYDYTLPSHC